MTPEDPTTQGDAVTRQDSTATREPLTPEGPTTPYRAPLIAFLVANVVSICGTRVSAIAIPWFVLVTTGSPVKMGLAAFAETLPLVLSKALGGPVIDRVGARRVSVAADAASAGVVALIPLLHVLHLLHFPTLLILVGIAGALRGPGDAAKATLVPDVAEAGRMPLERVTGLESTTERLAGFLAFLLAGGLIALVGPINALWIDAASFAVCAVLIRVWTPHRPGGTTESEEARHEGAVGSERRYLQQLGEGWRFLSRDRLLRPLVLMLTVTNLLDVAAFAVLLPRLDPGQRPRAGPDRADPGGLLRRRDSVRPARRRDRSADPPAGGVHPELPGVRRAPVRRAGVRRTAVGGPGDLRRERRRRGLHQPDPRRAVHRTDPARAARAGGLARGRPGLGRHPARWRPGRGRGRRGRPVPGPAARRCGLPRRHLEPRTDEPGRELGRQG
jgi:hypothetical protein